MGVRKKLKIKGRKKVFVKKKKKYRRGRLRRKRHKRHRRRPRKNKKKKNVYVPDSEIILYQTSQ